MSCRCPAYQDHGPRPPIYEPVADLLAAGNYAPLPNHVWPNPSVYDALPSVFRVCSPARGHPTVLETWTRPGTSEHRDRPGRSIPRTVTLWHET